MSGNAKEVLQRVPYPIYVLTSFQGDGADRRYNGSVVTWAMQAEMADPMKVVAAVAKSDYTYEFVTASGAFALHLLGKAQVDLAKRFGFQSGRKVDKFAGLPYAIGATGAPLLEEALGYVDCRVVQTLDTGPHVLFVAEVVGGGAQREGEPLMQQELFAAVRG